LVNKTFNENGWILLPTLMFVIKKQKKPMNITIKGKIQQLILTFI
jgi:hypothetical protein